MPHMPFCEEDILGKASNDGAKQLQRLHAFMMEHIGICHQFKALVIGVMHGKLLVFTGKGLDGLSDTHQVAKKNAPTRQRSCA